MDQPSSKNSWWKWLLIVDLVIVNIGVGYFLYQLLPTMFGPRITLSQIDAVPESPVDTCGDACQDYIEQQIVSQLATPSTRSTPTPSPSSTPRTTTSAPPVSKTRTVAYVTVPGSGSTLANSWTSLAGTDFYFNPADYPGLVEVYYEVNARLMNGNGQAYIRLYDSTHSIGVQQSDVSTASQTSTILTSGKVNFWAGRNLINVQAKSLTADTAIYDSGRLRIVTEN